jgi:outer membrane immunogenic protein
MRIYYLAAAFAVTVAAPAFAGTFHAEVHGGWDRVSVSGFKDDGIAYGVAAGYDIPLGEKAFIGVEGSVDDSSTKKCVSDVLVLGDRTCASAGRDLSAVARIGYKLNETSKIYALAGYANGRVKLSYNDGLSTTSDGPTAMACAWALACRWAWGRTSMPRASIAIPTMKAISRAIRS